MSQNSNTVDPRTPPYSIHAEQSLLGGILMDNEQFHEAPVQASDFYQDNHRRIYAAIGVLIGRGDPCDVVTLSEYLDAQSDNAGGLPYLGTLARYTPTAKNSPAYAKIVRDTSSLRQLLDAGAQIQADACQPEGRSVEELVDAAQNQVMTIGERDSGQEPAAIRDMTASAIDRLDERSRSDSTLVGLDTGYADLNNLTQGLKPGELDILAARPSMGKTTLAMNIATHVAKTAPVLVFSMEMPEEQLMDRLMASTGRVDFKRILTGNLRDTDWPKITSATSIIKNLLLHVDDRSALSLAQVSATARRHKRKHGLGLVVIDYLQLMQVKADNRNLEIGKLTAGLKKLAKDLKIPVLCLSQLNRGVENRPDARPVMADLRDSGSIEQDADVVVMLYRDEVYSPDSPRQGIAELLVRKNRNGPQGCVYATFIGKYLRFESFSGEVPAIEKRGGRPRGFTPSSQRAGQ